MAYCGSCGHELKDDSRFCDACGAPVEPIVTNAPEAAVSGISQKANRQRTSGVRRVLVVACAVLVVAALGVGGFCYAKESMPSAFGLVFVNEAAFPDDAFREAISNQIDANHNGIIKAEDLEAICAIELTKGGVEFVKATDEQPLLSIDGAEEGVAGNGDVQSLVGIEYFPNLQTLVLTGSGVSRLDLSQNTQLNYVDCRVSAIAQLDLSNNENITTLYCDPEVELTGLDEANLYFTDLVTSAESDDPMWPNERKFVTYDELGRPTQVVSDTGLGSERSVREYEYDAQGNIVKVSVGSTVVSQCEYDEDGNLITHVMNGIPALSASVPCQMSVSFEYSDGTLASSYREMGYQFTDDVDTRNGTYTIEDGLLMSYHSDRNGSSSKATEDASYSYNENGFLETEDSSYTWSFGGSRADRSYSSLFSRDLSDSGLCTSAILQGSSPSSLVTEYDDQGCAIQSSYGDFYTYGFECNADGYITKIRLAQRLENEAYEAEIAYVKRVGSRADLASIANVPKFVVQSEYFGTFWLTDLGSCWFEQTNGGGIGVTVVEQSPWLNYLERYGVDTNAVSTLNEVKLSQYMREALNQ